MYGSAYSPGTSAQSDYLAEMRRRADKHAADVEKTRTGPGGTTAGYAAAMNQLAAGNNSPNQPSAINASRAAATARTNDTNALLNRQAAEKNADLENKYKLETLRDERSNFYDAQSQERKAAYTAQHAELLNHFEQERDWRQAGYANERDYNQAVLQAMQARDSAGYQQERDERQHAFQGQQSDLERQHALEMQGNQFGQQAGMALLGHQIQTQQQQQHFDLQGRLHQVELDQTEQAHMNRLRNARTEVNIALQNGEIDANTARDAIAKIRTGLDPYEARRTESAMLTQELARRQGEQQMQIQAAHEATRMQLLHGSIQPRRITNSEGDEALMMPDVNGNHHQIQFPDAEARQDRRTADEQRAQDRADALEERRNARGDLADARANDNTQRHADRQQAMFLHQHQTSDRAVDRERQAWEKAHELDARPPANATPAERAAWIQAHPETQMPAHLRPENHNATVRGRVDAAMDEWKRQNPAPAAQGGVPAPAAPGGQVGVPPPAPGMMPFAPGGPIEAPVAPAAPAAAPANVAGWEAAHPEPRARDFPNWADYVAQHAAWRQQHPSGVAARQAQPQPDDRLSDEQRTSMNTLRNQLSEAHDEGHDFAERLPGLNTRPSSRNNFEGTNVAPQLRTMIGLLDQSHRRDRALTPDEVRQYQSAHQDILDMRPDIGRNFHLPGISRQEYRGSSESLGALLPIIQEAARGTSPTFSPFQTSAIASIRETIQRARHFRRGLSPNEINDIKNSIRRLNPDSHGRLINQLREVIGD